VDKFTTLHKRSVSFFQTAFHEHRAEVIRCTNRNRLAWRRKL